MQRGSNKFAFGKSMYAVALRVTATMYYVTPGSVPLTRMPGVTPVEERNRPLLESPFSSSQR